MVNAWSLLYSQMNGTMDEDYPIMSKNEDDVVILGGESSDTITFTSDGVGAADTVSIDYTGCWWGDDFSVTGNSTALSDTITFRTDGYPGSVKDSSLYGAAYDPITFGGSDTINLGPTRLPGGMGEDHISISGYAGTQYNDNKYYVDGYDPYPTVGSLDEFKPQPNLKFKSQKYQEDKGIADLKDYVSSTYQGHYTNENSDVQTLDLIHSVGDAESFCRSNALKYLSRYDKKGTAKRDILKAMHYCLLLYYFSGQTNETPTRGYETF